MVAEAGESKFGVRQVGADLARRFRRQGIARSDFGVGGRKSIRWISSSSQRTPRLKPAAAITAW
jgi:hypothetical protein